MSAALGKPRTREMPENIGAGEGNRTLVFSLEGCCSTIELHPLTSVNYHAARAVSTTMPGAPYVAAFAGEKPFFRL